MALQRIGTSVALDSSIACLVTGHKGKYSSNDKIIRLGQRRYIESLTLLKTSLAHGAQTVTAELIAATKILMLYE